MSYILSPGGFVESSSTFLDLAGLDHHFTTLGGARKPGTDLPVIADCHPVASSSVPGPVCPQLDITALAVHAYCPA